MDTGTRSALPLASPQNLVRKELDNELLAKKTMAEELHDKVESQNAIRKEFEALPLFPRNAKSNDLSSWYQTDLPVGSI